MIEPWHRTPQCPACGCPSVPSERAMRGDERPPGKMGCLGCGITWDGTPEQIAQAWRAERAWDREQERQKRDGEKQRKAEQERQKWNRAMKGEW
jgi:hypothetical protein